MSESRSQAVKQTHKQKPSPFLDFTKEENILQIFEAPPLQSSAKAGWQSIQLQHYSQLAGETHEFANPSHVIVIHQSQQPIELQHTFDGKKQIELLRPQQVGLLPQGVPRRGVWQDKVEFTLLLLDPVAVTRTAYESIDPDRITLIPRFTQSDPLIYQLGAALSNVLQTQPQNSQLYAESMATALSAHLLQFYSTQKKAIQSFSGGLPPYKLQQAIDYIQAHLTEDISLTEIADFVGISRYHFSRLFKKATGYSPYQYTIKCRVERSKELLRRKNLNITDVALEVGFSSPSHFTQSFKKLMGITPRQFIRQ